MRNCVAATPTEGEKQQKQQNTTIKNKEREREQVRKCGTDLGISGGVQGVGLRERDGSGGLGRAVVDGKVGERRRRPAETDHVEPTPPCLRRRGDGGGRRWRGGAAG